MSHGPGPGAAEPEPAAEPWLTGGEVAALWPVRTEVLPQAARRAGIRVRAIGGESRGTYGAAPVFYRYHPGDVRRAAAELAERRIDLPPAWRTDTPEGRRAEFWTRLGARVTGVLTLALLLAGLVLLVGSVGFVVYKVTTHH
ncbi:hypothetical protein [Kitasatospora cheerisanensis]|uniref:Uncharacterized protein n=1 Tax=Kitasatospora cheerisanensis KCTC 2395 TaxID=1348663 RepID=A0A066YVW1_9ACTN|nr:hypothetical protein [Kitasatospora cheerisanensis]KDN82201.1 hypothetical protein KCH_60350 [Kitasatospora cheerisanensis KCTC 2395]